MRIFVITLLALDRQRPCRTPDAAAIDLLTRSGPRQLAAPESALPRCLSALQRPHTPYCFDRPIVVGFCLVAHGHPATGCPSSPLQMQSKEKRLAR